MMVAVVGGSVDGLGRGADNLDGDTVILDVL